MKKICGNCFSRISGNVCRKCGHVNVRTSAEYDALPVGTQLRGRYTVGKLMGRGGFGMIYLAYDEQSDKTVAVKEFFPDGTAVRSQDNITAEPMTTIQQENYGEGLDRFFREAEIISGFPECSELIGIYDVFRENGTAYYAMEFVHGASLKSYAETSSAISSAQAVYIAQKLLPSLQILHQRGVIHRDVSPDNIMLCADGSVKLIDFGSARYIQDRTCSMSVILKQGFAPLEQYQRRGAQGGWTDIYSFGASLFYAMTLVTPEDPLTRLEDDSDFEFQLHGITPSLAEILRRSCNVRRELRYQNAEEMLGAVSVCGVEPVGFPADKIQQAVRSSAAPEGSLARGGTFLSTAAAALTSAASSAAEFFSGISRTITPIKVRIGGEMFPVNSVELDLSDRELTNAQIINLRHMKRLKVLNLNYNYITDLACLEGLTQLEELHFSHNNVTEDMLLSAMERAGSDSYDDDDDVEKKGLGTPATRAAIIETLVKRQYVERKGKQLIPTDKGIRVIDVVPEKVKSAAMTAEWESTLQKIAKGEADDQQFLSDIIAFTKQLIRENAGETSRNENPFRFSRLTVIGKCPNCGKNVYEFPKSYSCEDSRGACGFYFPREIWGKEVSETQAKRILDKGSSITLKGFLDRSGNACAGKLVLKDGRVRVELEK